jgi:hypothetical protein
MMQSFAEQLEKTIRRMRPLHPKAEASLREAAARQWEGEERRKLVLELIDAGYRTLAIKYHPDRGGRSSSHSQADRDPPRAPTAVRAEAKPEAQIGYVVARPFLLRLAASSSSPARPRLARRRYRLSPRRTIGLDGAPAIDRSNELRCHDHSGRYGVTLDRYGSLSAPLPVTLLALAQQVANLRADRPIFLPRNLLDQLTRRPMNQNCPLR